MEYEIDPDESVSAAVIWAVSAVEGCEPCSLPPLPEVLDPGALDSLFAKRFDGTHRNGGQVSFVYSHSRVTVENKENISIVPLADA